MKKVSLIGMIIFLILTYIITNTSNLGNAGSVSYIRVVLGMTTAILSLVFSLIYLFVTINLKDRLIKMILSAGLVMAVISICILLFVL